MRGDEEGADTHRQPFAPDQGVAWPADAPHPPGLESPARWIRLLSQHRGRLCPQVSSSSHLAAVADRGDPVRYPGGRPRSALVGLRARGVFHLGRQDARAGFPLSAVLFLAAALIEVFIAAVGVRRFAGGLRAFDNLRNLIVYLLVAVVLAPLTAAFVGASPAQGGATGSIGACGFCRRPRVSDTGTRDPDLDCRCPLGAPRLDPAWHRGVSDRRRSPRRQLPRLPLADGRTWRASRRWCICLCRSCSGRRCDSAPSAPIRVS